MHDIVAVVASHVSLAYSVIFLAALLEAVPVIGSFVPGSTVIVSLSALIPSGKLDLVSVLGAAIAGAALGDGLAYWLGHRYPKRILALWPLSAYPTLIERSEQFFSKHGSTAVFLARFLPPVRAFVPITAGTLGMPPQRFFTINLVAIVCWAPAHVVPGMLVGRVYGHGAWATHLSGPVVLGIIAAVLVAWVVRRWRHVADVSE